MRRRTLTIALILAAAVLAAPGAWAGGWFGLHIGSDGVGFSMGFSTWEPYTDRWYDASWSIDFDTALSPYGEWIWVDGLGRVWHPYVAASWRPYTYGRWVWTSYGWTWVAYEPWGYIPHHFGRWALCGSGWVWVPGYTYTPASVVWLSGGSLVGWYAAPPPGWHNAWWRGYDRGYRHGYRDGYWDGYRDARYATWVAWNDLTADNVARRAWSWHEVERRVPRGATRPLPSAPARAEVERRLGRPVPVARVSERTVKVGSRSVRVARPEGVRRDIERYASDTVTRGLDRRVATRIEHKVTAGERSVSSRSRRTVPGSNHTSGHGTPAIGGRRAPAAGTSSVSARPGSRNRSGRVVERRSTSGSRTATRSTTKRTSRATSRTVSRSAASSSTTSRRTRTATRSSSSRSSRTLTRSVSRSTGASTRSRTVTRSSGSRSARVSRSSPRSARASAAKSSSRSTSRSLTTSRTRTTARSAIRGSTGHARTFPPRSGKSHRPRR